MRTRIRGWRITAGSLFVILILFFAYTAVFSHADDQALQALISDETVTVLPTDYGLLFDGPSEDNALIFYPGGMDVCLVKMPFRLAVFGMNRADAVMARHSYRNWYIGGHSLGGAIAADYAAAHGDALRGVILLAAYPTKELSDDLSLLSIYGTEDGVLRMKQYEKGKTFWPDDSLELVIKGGNHAQFGNYGVQSGDGTASLTANEQQAMTASQILDFVGIEEDAAAA